MATQRVYPPAEQPEVEVLVDGSWYPGDLRSWTSTPDGWVAQVRWNRAPGENLLGNFPEDRVRPV